MYLKYIKIDEKIKVKLKTQFSSILYQMHDSLLLFHNDKGKTYIYVVFMCIQLLLLV